jgi:ribose transport system permease protein
MELTLRDAAESGAGDKDTKGRLRRLLEMREMGILLAALGIFIFLSIMRPDTFFTERNVFRVAQAISLLTIIAVGMTFLFIAGELDLSVGTLYGLLALFISKSMFVWGLHPLIAIILVMVVGAGLGFINGFLTTQFHIPSFIVTLGMLSIYRGFMLVWVNAPPIASREFKEEHAWYISATSSRVFGHVPAQIFWMVAVVFIAGFVLSRTKFGYHVYATGSNEQAAANAGINTRRVKIVCFMILGALTGLAAAVLIGWIGGISRTHGQGYELDVIAAVVIGGTNLFGGVGSIFGTFLGAAITGMITNGLVLLGAEQDTEPIAKGAVIILAVVLDVLIRRRQRIA